MSGRVMIMIFGGKIKRGKINEVDAGGRFWSKGKSRTGSGSKDFSVVKFFQ